MNFDHLKYDVRVSHFVDWIMSSADTLSSKGNTPLIVPLTVTFKPKAVLPSRVLSEYEKFYARLCRLLICNPTRPCNRHLLPFGLAFLDDPSTQPHKHPSAADILSNHPQSATHVHSILVIHPSLADRFLERSGELEAIWRAIPRKPADPDSPRLPQFDNGTLHVDLDFAQRVRKLLSAEAKANEDIVREELSRVVNYSAKLMFPYGTKGCENDLYIALPPSFRP